MELTRRVSLGFGISVQTQIPSRNVIKKEEFSCSFCISFAHLFHVERNRLKDENFEDFLL
jgi:endonuclease IV